MCFFPQGHTDADCNQSVYYSSGRESSSDQVADPFDFSKVPDVDPHTRSRLGSKLMSMLRTIGR